MNPIETLLEKALDRKSKRLTYKTTYSHDNLYAWLKTVLPSWEIFIPHQDISGQSSFPALSDGPSIIIRNTIKDWFEEQNVENKDDLLDGLCEPLAFYLSSKIKQDVELGKFHSIPYQTIKAELDTLEQMQQASDSAFEDEEFHSGFYAEFEG